MGQSIQNVLVSTGYVALLKTGDNQVLTSSMKRMSDGNGNDAPLWMSLTCITNNGSGGVVGNTSFGEENMGVATTANDNTAFGYGCLKSIKTGFENIAIGQNALCDGDNPSNNIAIGINAGKQINGGSFNILIGKNCVSAQNAASSTIAIGNDITAPATNGLAIGHGASITSVGQIAIGSASNQLGQLTTESLSSTKTFQIKINGTVQKFLLA